MPDRVGFLAISTGPCGPETWACLSLRSDYACPLGISLVSLVSRISRAQLGPYDVHVHVVR